MRRANAGLLSEALSSLDAASSPTPPAHFGHAYYKYCGLIDLDVLKPDWSRDKICGVLNEKGVPARVGACPDISQEIAFRNAYGAQPAHPNADSIADRTFMLPVHPTLSASNMAFIADTVRDVVLAATR